MFAVLFVLLISPFVYAQKHRRHRVGRSASGRAPVMTICVNDHLPSGYWIVRQIFDSRCPEVDNFNRAYLISISGEATDAMVASAPVSTSQVSVASSTQVSRASTEDAARAAAKERDDNYVAESKKQAALDEFQRKVEDAIRRGDILIGMNYDEVRKAWGDPSRVYRDVEAGSATVEIWTYGNRKLSFVSGLLVRIMY